AGVSTANPIYVDLAQMELVDAAITAQSGWTLVTGLVANDPSAAEANRDRLWVASNLARNAPARTVFIPAGNFYFCNRTNNLETPRYNMTLTSWHEGITFRGAGIWHTSILGGATFTLTGNNIAFMDMAFHGNEVIRRDNGARALFEHGFGANERGDGFVAHNLWITRYKCGFWFNDGINDIYITSNRVRDVFADGINMRSGAVNSHIVQNSFRNTGDDAIAQWSSPGQNTNTRVRNNTIVVPWLANAIAVYGGRDLDISYNIVQDTTHQGSAINVSRDFGAREFSGNIIVRGNLIERSGSPSRFGNLGAIWINVQNTINPNSLIIEENTILSSTFHAIFLNHGGRIENTIIRNNVINGASHALYVNQGPSGVVNFYGNQIGNITSQNIVSRGVTVDQTPSTGGGSGEPQVPVARVWFFNSGNWAQPRAHAWYYPISPPNYNTLLGSWMGERQNMRRYGATNWWYIDVETHQSTFNVIIRDDTNDQIRRVHVAINEFNRYISWNSLTSSGNVHTSRLAAQNASN
ncbi:MAG: hypothetical protein FWC11_06335, partial [Firmicutes bacterium]|nr:hypothetical protein [Bacillota bacterium]